MLRWRSAGRLSLARFQLLKYSPREVHRLKYTTPPFSSKKFTNQWKDQSTNSTNQWKDQSTESTNQWKDQSTESSNQWTDQSTKSTNPWNDPAINSSKHRTVPVTNSTDKNTDPAKKSTNLWTDQATKSTHQWRDLAASEESLRNKDAPEPEFDDTMPPVTQKKYYAFSVRWTMALEIEEMHDYWDEQIKAMEDALAEARTKNKIKVIQSNMIIWPFFLLKFLGSFSFVFQHSANHHIYTKDNVLKDKFKIKDLSISEEKRIATARELMSFMRKNVLYSKYVDHHLVKTEFAKVLFLQPGNETEVWRIMKEVESSYPLSRYDYDTAANMIELYARLGDIYGAEAILQDAKIYQKFKGRKWLLESVLKEGNIDLIGKYASRGNVEQMGLVFQTAIERNQRELFDAYMTSALNNNPRFTLGSLNAATSIQEIATEANAPHVTVEKGEWNDRGYCSQCGHKHHIKPLKAVEVQSLYDSFMDSTFARGDVYHTTTPEELEKMTKYLDTIASHYDVVVDGLNVFYLGKGNPIDAVLSQVVEKKGMRVLVVGREHLLGHIDPKWRNHEHVKWATVVNTSLDDMFLIMATLRGGGDTYVVSNDYMRNHYTLLPDNKKWLFSNWQLSRQIRVDVNTYRIRKPLDYDPFAQPDKGGWHIPFDPTGMNRFSPKDVFCIRFPYSENHKSKNKDKHKKKFVY